MEAIKKLKHAVTVARAQDPNMSMSVLVVLLALADGEEAEVRELQKTVNLTSSAFNRALTQLGEQHWSKSSKKEGLNLAVMWINPDDRRSRLVKLTPKGRSVIDAMME